MVDLESDEKINALVVNGHINRKGIVTGPILSGITSTFSKLSQMVPADELVHIQGMPFTNEDETKLANVLERIVSDEATNFVLLVPEYHLDYVTLKLRRLGQKKIEKKLKNSAEVILHVVTETEARSIIDGSMPEELRNEMPKEGLDKLTKAWVEHSKRKFKGHYFRHYETYLPGLLKSEIEETKKRWRDTRLYGLPDASKFAKSETERLRKKRKGYSALFTIGSISAALLSEEAHSTTETIQSFISAVFPTFALAAAGIAASIIGPSLVADIRRWFKGGGKEKVRLEEFFEVMQYWKELSVEERRLLCYEFDQKKKCEPGKSYDDLSSAFDPVDVKTLERQKRELQDEFQKKLDMLKINLESEMMRLEDKFGQKFDELEKLKDSVAEINEDLMKYMAKLDEQIEELRTKCTQCGLDMLDPKYFETHKGTGDWMQGYRFELPDIKQGCEFRRARVIAEVEAKLENDRMLIIVGEAGASKSVVLKEVMCDYFEKGYKIFYDFYEPIRRPIDLRKLVEEQVEKGRSVLVAIDDGQTRTKAPIYCAMKELLSYTQVDKVRCILAARLPDYDDLCDKLSWIKQEEYRDGISFFKNRNTYHIPPFSLSEVKEFIKFYASSLAESPKLDEISERIYEASRKGHPILVFWQVFGKGLDKDVEKRYTLYLTKNGEVIGDLMVAAIVCSLFDIALNGVNVKLLKKMGLLESAETLEHRILFRNEEGVWNTLHPAWAKELLRYLYPSDEKNRDRYSRNQGYFKNALDKINSLRDETVISYIIDLVYGLASNPTLPLRLVEKTVEIPEYVGKYARAKIYTLGIGLCYIKLGKHDEAIKCFDKALKLDPEYAEAWNNKGIAFGGKAYASGNEGLLDKAIKCFDKALKLNPNLAKAWNNKGIALHGKKLYDEAIGCYDEALKLNPEYAEAWSNKAEVLINEGLSVDAVKCKLKALSLFLLHDVHIGLVPHTLEFFFAYGDSKAKADAAIILSALLYLADRIDKEEYIHRVEDAKESPRMEAIISALKGKDKPIIQKDIVDQAFEFLRTQILKKAST